MTHQSARHCEVEHTNVCNCVLLCPCGSHCDNELEVYNPTFEVLSIKVNGQLYSLNARKRRAFRGILMPTLNEVKTMKDREPIPFIMQDKSRTDIYLCPLDTCQVCSY